MHLTPHDFLRWSHAFSRTDREGFALPDWLEGPLREFYEYQHLIVAHGSLVAGRIRVSHMLACGHRPDYLEQLQRDFDLDHRGCLRYWQAHREPFFIDISAPSAHASPFEIGEMQRFGFRNISGHGILNIRANAGIYMSFANVAARPPGWHLDALRLMAPQINALYLQYLAIRQPDRAVELNGLTPRQREIVAWLARGANDKVIARELGLSEKTVRNQLSSVYARLGIHKRTELMAQLL